MSGGAYQYLYSSVNDFANSIDPDADRNHEAVKLRKRFAKHLKLVADAMYAIEWVDSGDMSSGDEVDAIKKALGEK